MESGYQEDFMNWKDPNPEPILQEYDGITVVRDDTLGVGSKVRFIDYLISSEKDIKEWCFGCCPATGYAQISLPYVCKRYGKEAHLFMAARSMDKLHPFQQEGIRQGSIYHWIPNGMLTVTKKRAADYVAEAPNERKLLPLGLEHPTVTQSIIKVARDLPIVPDHVWSVGSSGCLNRGLQKAWPDAEVHVVSVGHKMSEQEIGRAIYHRSKYSFDRPIKDSEKPPFPSAKTYDSKCWPIMIEWKNKTKPKGKILMWNVA